MIRFVDDFGVQCPFVIIMYKQKSGEYVFTSPVSVEHLVSVMCNIFLCLCLILLCFMVLCIDCQL